MTQGMRGRVFWGGPVAPFEKFKSGSLQATCVKSGMYLYG